MAEFTAMEQQMLTKDMTAEQKMLFASQMGAATKDRNTAMILSVLFGAWGVDRFFVGDMGLGLLKLFTLGVCGVMWLIDIFLIRGRVDDLNRQKANEIAAAIRITA